MLQESGGFYQEERKCWLLKHDKYQGTLKALDAICKDFDIVIEPIPDYVFNYISACTPFQNSSRNVAGYDYSLDPEVNSFH